MDKTCTGLSATASTMLQLQSNKNNQAAKVEQQQTEAGNCEHWCQDDFDGGNNQGRHCAPGNMADKCGDCSFCQAVNCASWCQDDFDRGQNQGRHCAPGNMADKCGDCSFCQACDSNEAPVKGQHQEATCGSRRKFLENTRGMSESDAKCQVKKEEPQKCACLACPTEEPPTPPPTEPPTPPPMAESVCVGDEFGRCCTDNPFQVTSDRWATYDNGAGGKWSNQPGLVRFDFANDIHCGGNATKTQIGEATLHVKVDTQVSLLMSMDGKGENTYETFTLSVDGNEMAKIVASKEGSSTSCATNTCAMCDVSMPQKSLDLQPGSHTITSTTNSNDGQFHSGAYFEIAFSVPGCSCECPTTQDSVNDDFFSEGK